MEVPRHYHYLEAFQERLWSHPRNRIDHRCLRRQHCLPTTSRMLLRFPGRSANRRQMGSQARAHGCGCCVRHRFAHANSLLWSRSSDLRRQIHRRSRRRRCKWTGSSIRCGTLATGYSRSSGRHLRDQCPNWHMHWLLDLLRREQQHGCYVCAMDYALCSSTDPGWFTRPRHAVCS